MIGASISSPFLLLHPSLLGFRSTSYMIAGAGSHSRGSSGRRASSKLGAAGRASDDSTRAPSERDALTNLSVGSQTRCTLSHEGRTCSHQIFEIFRPLLPCSGKRRSGKLIRRSGWILIDVVACIYFPVPTSSPTAATAARVSHMHRLAPSSALDLQRPILLLRRACSARRPCSALPVSCTDR